MSKCANHKVEVKLKNVRICEDSPHLAEWIYRGKHQRWLSRKDLQRLQNGHTLRLMTTNPPVHAAKIVTHKYKKGKTNEKMASNKRQ